MEIFAIVIVLLLCFFVLMAIAKGRVGAPAGTYQAIPFLLSKAERSFFGVFTQAIGSYGNVFAKVRVADVLAPSKGLGRAGWQRAFNAISAKHFDFIVCDRNTSAILLAVELDDASHSNGRRQVRDDFLNKACASAGVPLLRIKAASGYVVTEIRRQALGLMAVSAAEDHASVDVPKLGSLTLNESVQTAELPPVCPACGDSMVLRKARSGANAGGEFWGCSRYPKCRGMLPQAHSQGESQSVNSVVDCR